MTLKTPNLNIFISNWQFAIYNSSLEITTWLWH